MEKLQARARVSAAGNSGCFSGGNRSRRKKSRNFGRRHVGTRASRRYFFTSVSPVSTVVLHMAGACFRLKRLLLGPFFAKPPNPPSGLTVVPRHDGFDVSWRPGVFTSEYNRDRFEVEMKPTSPALLELLGESFATHVPFYSGVDITCVIDKLQPSQPFSLRLRCVNRAGASVWIEHETETCLVPVGCGGAGPDESYVWDQTPTHVEVRIPCPQGLSPRAVDVNVKPKHVSIQFGGHEVKHASGELFANVLCQPGDFEWELRDVSGEESGRHELFLTLEKQATVSYHPMDQWDCLFIGTEHKRIDRREMRWLRDGEWRPPQDASNRNEVAAALPGMTIYERNQDQMSGRDGELDDWGKDWGDKGKKKRK